MRLFFFTGRDGEWRLDVDARAAVKVGARPREAESGLQFPRKVDMILTDEGEILWH